MFRKRNFELRRRMNATRWPERETVTDASQRRTAHDDCRNSRAIGRQITIVAQMRGETESPAAVHNRDRWTGYSFHSHSFET